MHKRIAQSFLIGILFLAISSCKTNDSCEDIACTLIFISESVKVIDQNDNPVALDDFQVINIGTNENITRQLSTEEFQMAQQLGSYPLVSDLDVEPQQTIEIQFQGFQSGTQIITENYTVSADCCHIGTPEGNLEIRINN